MAYLGAPEEGSTVGTINGQKAASSYEWNVAVALYSYGWDFSYQVSYFGGRRIAGGQVLDFLVHTPPLLTPIYVYGEYYHANRTQERDRWLITKLKAALHGRIREPLIWTGEQCATIKDAKNSVLQHLGRAS